MENQVSPTTSPQRVSPTPSPLGLASANRVSQGRRPTQAEKRAQRAELAARRREKARRVALQRLRAPMPRIYNKFNRMGEVSAEQFEKEFTYRLATLNQPAMRYDDTPDARAIEGEDVDVAEPHLTAKPAAGGYNAACGRHLTEDYARSEAPLTACAMTGDLHGMRIAAASGRYGLDAHDVKGDCPVTLAALHGQAPALRLLAEMGASLDAVDAKGWSAAHGAAAGKHPSVLRMLHELGARLDLRDRTGSAPAHYAARFNDTSCLRTLLVLAYDTCACAALHTRLTPLHHAALANSAGACVLLAAALDTAALHAADAGGDTPLHKAARAGAAAAYRELVRRGADSHAPNHDGETPHDILRDRLPHAAPVDEAALLHHSNDPPRATFAPSAPLRDGSTTRTGPAEQARKRQLQNELHRMRLEARRAVVMSQREALCAAGARREVAVASKLEDELKRAAKLDVAIRRDVRLVAERQHERKKRKQAEREARRKRVEKQRRVAAKKAERKRRMAEFQREKARKELLKPPSQRQ